MEIKTESDVTGDVAKGLRKAAGLTQVAFWGSVGVTQTAGCKYEAGYAVPRPVRILVFAAYVAGLRIDASTAEGAERLARLGRLQASEYARKAEDLGAVLADAKTAIKRIDKLLAATV